MKWCAHAIRSKIAVYPVDVQAESKQMLNHEQRRKFAFGSIVERRTFRQLRSACKQEIEYCWRLSSSCVLQRSACLL